MLRSPLQVLALFSTLISGNTLFANSITVTSLADSGAGSLRDAIAGAAAGDTVNFNTSLSGQSITLDGVQLVIDKNLTIDASSLSNGITIDADRRSRVLKIDPGTTVELNSLTITGGNATGAIPDNPNILGGGIFSNQANLSLVSCTVRDNNAESGGGIFSSGAQGSATLNLTTCTISGNIANYGGGIYSRGSYEGSAILNATNSTISGNSCESGGGIYNDALNRGSATVNLTRCTLSSNSANGGGGINNSAGSGNAHLNLTACTVSNNDAFVYGSGISNDGDAPENAVLTLQNSILAGNNDATYGPDLSIYENRGSTVLLGVNLFSDLSDTNGLTPGPNLIVATNPKLASIANYGGPTKTMPPLPGSPAIEGAILLPGSSPIDQIGNPRPSGPLPDIGAVEALPISLQALPSNDGDTIPDILEGPGKIYSHLSHSADDSAVDTDGDGSTDAEEVANMTDPLDASSRFRMLSFGPAIGFDPTTNPVFELTITTFPGLSYRLQTGNLSTGFADVPGSQFTATDFTETLSVTLGTNGDFVRARRDK